MVVGEPVLVQGKGREMPVAGPVQRVKNPEGTVVTVNRNSLVGHVGLASTHLRADATLAAIVVTSALSARCTAFLDIG